LNLRASIEVADIFRAAGAAYRRAHAGHLSLPQLKVMSAVENCRTAALGGHVEACEDCGQRRIAYNSCRNRHCPRCQGTAARTWLAEREADLLPVGYFHVVFTLPAEIADIAFQNKALVYDLLFKAASETMLTIAVDRKHLGARIGITAVLHTWGSAMTHHPHVHMIVPGGGDHCRRQGRDESSDRPEKPRIRTTKRPVSVHNPAHWLRSCDRGYKPQIEISVAFNCGPRVPSSGTFVRLPAPETLHETGMAIFRRRQHISGRELKIYLLHSSHTHTVYHRLR
jgi:hypothetical protein